MRWSLQPGWGSKTGDSVIGTELSFLFLGGGSDKWDWFTCFEVVNLMAYPVCWLHTGSSCPSRTTRKVPQSNHQELDTTLILAVLLNQPPKKNTKTWLRESTGGFGMVEIHFFITFLAPSWRPKSSRLGADGGRPGDGEAKGSPASRGQSR